MVTGGEQSDVGRVQERLAVLADAIEKMRAAVGKVGLPPNTVRMKFAKEHDQMLTTLVCALAPFLKPLQLDIPTTSYSRGKASLEAWWKEKRE